MAQPNGADALAVRRFRLLVEQMRDEEGAAHGWKTRVGKRLGLTGTMVGYIESGARRPSVRTIEEAQRRLHLDPAFFHDRSLGEPHYSDHVVRGAPPAPDDPPHWREFLERYERLGELKPEQVEDLKRFAARNFRVRSWTDYERIAEIVRTSLPSPTYEAARREQKRRRRGDG